MNGYQVRVIHPFSGLREGVVLTVDNEFMDKFGRYLEVMEEFSVEEEAPKPRARKAKNGASDDLQGEG